MPTETITQPLQYPSSVSQTSYSDTGSLIYQNWDDLNNMRNSSASKASVDFNYTLAVQERSQVVTAKRDLNVPLDATNIKLQFRIQYIKQVDTNDLWLAYWLYDNGDPEDVSNNLHTMQESSGGYSFSTGYDSATTWGISSSQLRDVIDGVRGVRFYLEEKTATAATTYPKVDFVYLSAQYDIEVPSTGGIWLGALI